MAIHPSLVHITVLSYFDQNSSDFRGAKHKEELSTKKVNIKSTVHIEIAGKIIVTRCN